jgi:hypothetical protein
VTPAPRFTSVWQSLGVSIRALVPGTNPTAPRPPDDPIVDQSGPSAAAAREWAQTRLDTLITQHGDALVRAPSRCERLIRMRCGSHRLEADLLCRALRAQIPEDLLNARQIGSQFATTVATLTERLTACDVSRADARWAVEAWAQAIGNWPPKSEAGGPNSVASNQR